MLDLKITARGILNRYSNDQKLKYVGDCFGRDELTMTAEEFWDYLDELGWLDSEIPFNSFEEIEDGNQWQGGGENERRNNN